eukprot:scaffold46786_cov38-Prasinocladus_malaysianus.AAC.1
MAKCCRSFIHAPTRHDFSQVEFATAKTLDVACAHQNGFCPEEYRQKASQARRTSDTDATEAIAVSSRGKVSSDAAVTMALRDIALNGGPQSTRRTSDSQAKSSSTATPYLWENNDTHTSNSSSRSPMAARRLSPSQSPKQSSKLVPRSSNRRLSSAASPESTGSVMDFGNNPSPTPSSGQLRAASYTLGQGDSRSRFPNLTTEPRSGSYTAGMTRVPASSNLSSYSSSVKSNNTLSQKFRSAAWAATTSASSSARSLLST